MSIRQELQFESGLLKVEARGDFSLEEAKRAFLAMLEAVAQYRAEKILFDGRNLTGTPEHIERFFYGYFAATETIHLIAKCGLPRPPRFAYVMHEPLRDPRRYGESVAANRGMIVKTFGTPDEASQWLELTPPSEPGAGNP
jgi:hypothetical protein